MINFNCEGIGTHMKKCVVEFKNGLLTLDGSKGISSNQVKYLNLNDYAGIYIYLIYEDSNNKLVSAWFGNTDMREGSGFQTSFLNWMSEGK